MTKVRGQICSPLSAVHKPTMTTLPPSTTGVGAVFNTSLASQASLSAPQPRTSPVAHFSSVANDGVGNDTISDAAIGSGKDRGLITNGRLLAVNSTYVAYAVKKGLVRVIDRRTAAKTLLRGHGEQTRIVDAAFFGTEGSSQTKEGVAVLWKDLSDQRRRQQGQNVNGGNGQANTPVPPSGASDILATVGGMQDEACVLIWRIYGGTHTEEMGADKIFELKFPLAARIVWHPFNPNKFMLLHRNVHDEESSDKCRSVATMAETTRLVTTRHQSDGHGICDCKDSKVPGAVQFVVSDAVGASQAGANDVAWSNKDARHVLTAHDDGIVRLWDVTLPVTSVNPETGRVGEEGPNNSTSFQCISQLNVASVNASISQSSQVTRVLFLSQYESELSGSTSSITPPIITGTDMNHTITLWSAFSTSSVNKVVAPQRLRVFNLNSYSLPSISSMISVEMCPAPYRPSVDEATPSSFLLLAERTAGSMHALHLDTAWRNDTDKETSGVVVSGFDYVTTLNVVHPVLSLCLAPTTEDDEKNGATLADERDVDLCCVKSKAVQMLSLSAAMLCAPPKDLEGELAPGVTLLELADEGGDAEAIDAEFEDNYDMDEDDAVEYSGDDTGDDAPNPLASLLQSEKASAVTADTAADDPFSNWLGAIANPIPPPTTTSASAPSPPPPPGLGFGALSPPPGMDASEGMSFLSPMEILSASGSDLDRKDTKKPNPPPNAAKKPATAPGKKKKGDDSSKKTPTTAPMTILKRAEPKEAKAETSSSAAVLVGASVDASDIATTMESVLAAQMKSYEKGILDVVRKTVASEVEAAVGSSLEDAGKATELAFQKALVGDSKFNKKLEKAAKESAALAAREAVSAMQAPIMSSLHHTMREVMIPAFEAATRQMFQQVSVSVEQGMAQLAANQTKASATSLDAMSAQMMKMAEAIQTLSAEVSQLRSSGAGGGAAASAQSGVSQKAPSAQQPRLVDPRKEIVTLCHAQRYEEAFTKAVSASNGDIVLFACKHADISVVFNGEVTLSQTILICLMQQLGAVLVSTSDPGDFKTIVTWLQECAVTIDPTNESIQRRKFLLLVV